MSTPFPLRGLPSGMFSRTPRLSVWFLLLAVPLPGQDRPGSYREQARVERVVVDAFVLDPRGDPIPDLTVRDFRLRVDGKAAPIESVEWIPADQLDALPILVPSSPKPLASGPSEIPPGRLLIFFFQTDQFVEARLV